MKKVMKIPFHKMYAVDKTGLIILIWVFLVFLAAAMTPAFSQGTEEKKEGRIKWAPVDGAIGYKVTLKTANEETLVMDKTVNENVFSFNVPYGTYKYRIGIISKFHKIYTWSGWRSLKVKSPAASIDSVHLFGWSSGYLLPSLNRKNAYRGSLNGGVFYENHGFFSSFPYLYRGLGLTSYYFVGSSEKFSTSWMMTGSAFLGVGYPNLKTPGNFFHVSLYAGYKHYYRVHEFQNEKYVASRPIILTGAGIKILPYSNLVIGVNLEYNMVMDNAPVNTVAAKLNVGFSM